MRSASPAGIESEGLEQNARSSRTTKRGHTPHGHWKTITFVAALRNDGMVAPFVVDGPMNGPTFVSYIEQCLAPTLDRRDVVIMDNLGAHKVAGVREAIEAVGAKLRYLPQYSPDLNPIEQSFQQTEGTSAQSR
jgi:transposase